MGRKSRMKKERKEREALQELDNLLLNAFLDTKISQAFEEKERRNAQGEFNRTHEKYAHLLTPNKEELRGEKAEGLLRRQAWYAMQMGGVPSNHSQTKEKKGWLLPYLWSLEWFFWGRWEWWQGILEKETLQDCGPIPQIKWCTNPQHIRAVHNNLSDCLYFGWDHGYTIDDFANWLLWALNVGEKHPTLISEVNEYWYKTFNLDLMIKFPHDYMSGLIAEAINLGYAEDTYGHSYIDNPNFFIENLERLLIDINDDPEKLKHKGVYDPKLGCGPLLLPHSNYTLFASGHEIHPVALKLAKVQFMIYAPWYAMNPFHEKLPEDIGIREQNVQ